LNILIDIVNKDIILTTWYENKEMNEKERIWEWKCISFLILLTWEF